MTDYNPPTEDLPIFDSSVFMTGDIPITQSQADKRYLRYPNAQGTENLQEINVNGVANFNSNSIFNDDITIDASQLILENNSYINQGTTNTTSNSFGLSTFNDDTTIDASQLILDNDAYINQGTTNTTSNSFGLSTFNDDITIADGVDTATIGVSNAGNFLRLSQNINSGSIILSNKDSVGTTTNNFSLSSSAFNLTTTTSGYISAGGSLINCNASGFSLQGDDMTLTLTNPPTCPASSTILLTDDSNKLPSTAWVRDYVTSVPPTIPDNLTPNSITVTPTSSTTTYTTGIINKYNTGGICSFGGQNLRVYTGTEYTTLNPIIIRFNNEFNGGYPVFDGACIFRLVLCDNTSGLQSFSTLYLKIYGKTVYGDPMSANWGTYGGKIYALDGRINGNPNVDNADPVYSPNGRQYYSFNYVIALKAWLQGITNGANGFDIYIYPITISSSSTTRYNLTVEILDTTIANNAGVGVSVIM